MIITAKNIREMCARRTGRTTQIRNDLYEFLTSPTPTRSVVVLICINRHVIDDYLRYFNSLPPGLLRMITKQSVTSSLNSNRVIFMTDDTFQSYQSSLKGLKLHDVYFDTPETTLFGRSELFEIMSRLM
jgi:hypothetical protein